MNTKGERIIGILKDLGAKFLLLNGNNSSLLTVTRVELTDDRKRATIFFTVFPDTYEKTALEFAKRKRGEFKEFVRDNSKIGMVPQLDFEIDFGEKNRQKIDTLLQE